MALLNEKLGLRRGIELATQFAKLAHEVHGDERHGIEADVLNDPSDLLALLKSMLPHAADYVDKFGTNATSATPTSMVASIH